MSGPFGLLAEGARTNLLTYSEAWTGWATNATTSITQNATSPRGDSTMSTWTSSGGETRLMPVEASATSTQYTQSIHAKLGATNRYLWLRDFSNNIDSCFDIQTGVVVSSGAGHTCSIVAMPNGVFRCAVTLTTAAVHGTTADLFWTQSSSAVNVSAGTAAGTMLVWGAQREAASFPSSYIPTTTTNVTRNADELTYARAGNVDTSAGTVCLEAALADLSVTNRSLIGDGNGASAVMNVISTTTVRMNDGSATRDHTVSALALSTLHKFASKWGGDTLQAAVNGALGTPTGQAFDGTMDWTGTIRIGDSTVFGTIRNVRIFGRALSDARLQQLTS